MQPKQMWRIRIEPVTDQWKERGYRVRVIGLAETDLARNQEIELGPIADPIDVQGDDGLRGILQALGADSYVRQLPTNSPEPYFAVEPQPDVEKVWETKPPTENESISVGVSSATLNEMLSSIENWRTRMRRS